MNFIDVVLIVKNVLSVERLYAYTHYNKTNTGSSIKKYLLDLERSQGENT